MKRHVEYRRRRQRCIRYRYKAKIVELGIDHRKKTVDANRATALRTAQDTVEKHKAVAKFQKISSELDAARQSAQVKDMRTQAEAVTVSWHGLTLIHIVEPTRPY